ncbi:putative Zn finger protein [Streptosporangium becharense]|uniref:Putative Zn finger protein n=1 Tax=Streptosporangium becharense TaxID=1816182 RepID=A0A7W9MGV5_9ACTN|nr:SWIM zinc finger family protein [Streptosporangium becharense]MBB2909086.1 putative Zn finger protein [Streptosporangium becharense]MBB5819896.1 putative Zn finger protein [Streptosporangium becharense]
MQGIAGLIAEETRHAERAALVRGDALVRSGAVQPVRFGPSLVIAEVDDDAARVEFRLVDGVLHWSCTCAEGRNGVLCAHCVATAQSVMIRTERKDSPDDPSATASASTTRMAS